MKIATLETIKLEGVSRLRAWPKGVIPALMKSGMSLAESQELVAPALDDLRKNIVTTVGKELLAAYATGNAPSFLTWHAIGTGTATPVTGDTRLTTEVKRKGYATRIATGAMMTFSVFYLASECAYSIREVGWFGGSAATQTANSGTLFSHVLQSHDNGAGTYDLAFDYSLILS